ncbi:MAG: glycosyltransferase family 4 protein [Gemmatimonadota bacterium]|jgi:phosphatidylinositol alpha-mannosyltransferase|nr:glycosyltransferase family 4 protein [Gemmatimonadota bacterium]
MRIAIVAQPYYPQNGGITENVHHTALELRERGHEVDIITSRFRGHEHSTPGVHRVGRNVLVPHLGAFSNMNADPRLRPQVARIYRDHSFDVIHVHTPLSPTLPLVAIREAPAGVPVVGTFHASAPASAGYRAFRPWLNSFATRLNARIAVSQSARRFARHYFPGEYRIVPNGVDPTRFRPGLPPIEGITQGPPTILLVGRFYPRKGVPVLLRALPRIAREIPGLRVLIVGDGPLGAWYRSRATRLPCEVRFLGELSTTQIPRAYAAADLFVAPATRNESFGIVHLEAMASGVPIVASRIEGYAETLDHGREALLFRPSDSDDLAQAAIAVLQNPERARSMAQHGRTKAARMSWARIALELESLYLEQLSRPPSFAIAS